MRVIDCQQGSPEWLEHKRGIPSASDFDRIVVPNTSFQVWLNGEKVSNHRLEPAAFEKASKLNKKAEGHIVREVLQLSDGAIPYICELIASKHYLGPMDDLSGPANAAMRNGINLEPKARAAYELVTGNTVTQTGFIISGRVGCSPDGLIGEDGMLEAKCPEGKAHVNNLYPRPKQTRP